MNETLFRRQLAKFHACSEACNWVGERTAHQAWLECERGDWMLWLAGTVGVDRKLLVLAACACAREALQFVPSGEERPRRAIEIAESWARGDVGVTFEDVRTASASASAASASAASAASVASASAYAAAYAAASAASAYAAAYAASASAYAASASAASASAASAYAAAYAASASAYAASAYAASAASAYAERSGGLGVCADHVRRLISFEALRAASEGK